MIIPERTARIMKVYFEEFVYGMEDLTTGKRYDTYKDIGFEGVYNIVDDAGDEIGILIDSSCCHLEGGRWIVEEETDD